MKSMSLRYLISYCKFSQWSYRRGFHPRPPHGSSLHSRRTQRCSDYNRQSCKLAEVNGKQASCESGRARAATSLLVSPLRCHPRRSRSIPTRDRSWRLYFSRPIIYVPAIRAKTSRATREPDGARQRERDTLMIPHSVSTSERPYVVPMSRL